jgi:hypothetical protein
MHAYFDHSATTQSTLVITGCHRNTYIHFTLMQRPHEALWPLLAAINEPMAARDLEPTTYKVDQNKINAAKDLLRSFEKSPSCVIPNQVVCQSLTPLFMLLSADLCVYVCMCVHVYRYVCMGIIMYHLLILVPNQVMPQSVILCSCFSYLPVCVVYMHVWGESV